MTTEKKESRLWFIPLFLAIAYIGWNYAGRDKWETYKDEKAVEKIKAHLGKMVDLSNQVLASKDKVVVREIYQEEEGLYETFKKYGDDVKDQEWLKQTKALTEGHQNSLRLGEIADAPPPPRPLVILH